MGIKKNIARWVVVAGHRKTGEKEQRPLVGADLGDRNEGVGEAIALQPSLANASMTAFPPAFAPAVGRKEAILAFFGVKLFWQFDVSNQEIGMTRGMIVQLATLGAIAIINPWILSIVIGGQFGGHNDRMILFDPSDDVRDLFAHFVLDNADRPLILASGRQRRLGVVA